MAGTITSAGLGSGLAVESIISQLMQLERQPITQLQSRISTVDARLSSLGKVKSAMSALQAAADKIKSPAGFALFKTEVGDSKVLTASAGSKANVANHSIEVKSLANTQKLAATGLASSTSTIPTGTLKLELGTLDTGVYTPDANRTYDIPINGTNNTLEGLRDAINNLDADVTASIVNDGSANPARLVLSPKDSGNSNVIRTSGLAGFDFDPEAPLAGSMEQTVEPKDAIVVIDGITVTKPSNVITDALEGITLNLTAENDGAPTTLKVSQDNEGIKANIQAFVNAYNEVNNLIRSETSFNADSGKAGTLNSDASVRSVRDQLRTIASSSLSSTVGGLNRLSDIGITFTVEGAMTINSADLDEALADPSKDVAGLFGGSSTVSGLATQLSERLGSLLGVDGTIASRTSSYTQTKDNFGDRIDSLEQRMTAIEARYRRQYAALDTLVASMNGTSSFLSQQLTALQGLSSNR